LSPSIISFLGIPLLIPIPYGSEILRLLPLFLVVSGILTILYAFVRWKTPGKTTGAEVLLGIVTFIIGLLLPLGAALCFLNSAYGTFTIILLLILSVALVLGPISRILKKIPTLGIAAVLALVISYVIATVATALIPSWLQSYLAAHGINHIALIILFIAITAILFLMLLFAKGLIQLIGVVFGAWPIMMIIGVICILQGVLLAFGMSLTQAFELIMVP
jgi:hypothetical protein